MPALILTIDDDSEFATFLTLHLQKEGYQVLHAASGPEAMALLAKDKPSLILLDVMLGQESGISLLPAIQNSAPQVPVLMISSMDKPQIIVDAMKAGATDYITKPVDFALLKKKLTAVLALSRTKETVKALDNESTILIGESPKTRQLIHDISKVANSDATVFLRGESGTGKSLIAELIHQHSTRRDKPFITLNCAAIPANLLESELFGHEKGSFTGAIRDKIGKFEFANHGTIFLDEIGDLNPELQVKILRVLQSHEFEPVGGLKTRKVDVRVIAATNRDIEVAVSKHEFREDLFYRLNVLPIFVPPLRERREDILPLARNFLAIYARKAGKNIAPPSASVCAKLLEYNWPGNVRELQNVLERAVILASDHELGDITLTNLPKSNAAAPALSQTGIQSIRDIEYRAIISALEASGGNMTKAAAALSIGRDTLYRRLRKFGISPKRQTPN